MYTIIITITIIIIIPSLSAISDAFSSLLQVLFTFPSGLEPERPTTHSEFVGSAHLQHQSHASSCKTSSVRFAVTK